jgi:signal peptidase I
MIGGLAIALTWFASPTPTSLALLALNVVAMVSFRIFVVVDAARRVRSKLPRIVRPWYQSTWVTGLVILSIELAIDFVPRLSPEMGWRTFSISSTSTMPGLMQGDWVMTDIRPGEMIPEHGEMIVFKYPKDPKVEYLKRVVGVPGDRVQLKKGILHLNGQAAARDFIGEWSFTEDSSKPVSTPFKRYKETLPGGRSYEVLGLKPDDDPAENTVEYVVPQASVFVLGDNRDNSMDSRFFSYVPVSYVIGRPGTVYWSRDVSRLFTRVE